MNSSEQPIDKNKGRRSFIFVCIAFIAPIILAKFALEHQWIDYGVTNKGQLLEQPVNLNELQLTHIQPDSHWLMVFNMPTTCEQACIETFNGLTNTYIALGKEVARTKAVALANAPFSADVEDKINRSRWQIYTDVNQNFPLLAEEKVLIVDPLGNVVLSHELPADVEQLPAFGKAILADFKKLLKYSKIG